MARKSGENLLRKSPESVGDFDLSVTASRELHVLAVDDSHVDRKVIERLLKISCCKVTLVESGSRALQYLGLDGEKSSIGFDALKVNLIITDYSMPGMTGYELLKKIKGSSTLREIPVVIMSSENVVTRIDRCMEEGAEEFLLKPVKLSDVKRLKNFMLNSEGNENSVKEEYNNHKRKLLDNCIISSTSLQLSSPSLAPDQSSFSLSSAQSSPVTPPLSSPQSSPVTPLPLQSPLLQSPSKRRKIHLQA